MRVPPLPLLRPVFLAGGLALAVACSTQAPDAVASDPGLIINGTADSTHPAVVAVFGGSGDKVTLCSGTIIKKDVDRKIAWVLTAAHCVASVPTVALLTDDYARDSLRLNVIDWAADPLYTGDEGFLHDFAVIRVGGADERTSVIPLAEAPDDLEAGATVTSIGFGRTTVEASTAGPRNGKRNAVRKTVRAVTENHIAYDMATRGICMGDSGGPVLASVAGVAGEEGERERVVGVHSFVQNGCDGRGFSGRVATAGAAFLAAELEKDLPADSCSVCSKIAASGTNACAKKAASCLGNASCRGYSKCIADRKPSADCARDFPLGEGPYRTTTSCTCNSGCTRECAKDTKCAHVPKCGVKMNSASCASCVDTACCAEASTCSADGRCYSCLKGNDAESACLSNAARTSLASCIASKCSTECASSTTADEPGIKDPPSASAERPPEPTSTQPQSDPKAGTDPTAPTPDEPAMKAASCTTSSGAHGHDASSWAALSLGALAIVISRRRRS